MDLPYFLEKSLVIQYETLRFFHACLDFSRWHVYGWYTVNHSIAHILVTFYLTCTKISVTLNTVLQSTPINHTWANSCLLQFIFLIRKSIVFPSYNQLFFLQPKTNDHSKFSKFFSHIYLPQNILHQWHLIITFHITISNMNLFKRRICRKHSLCYVIL